MTWLRALPLRVVFGVTLILAIIATHMSVGKARLPFVLLDSFDKALSMVSTAADRRMDQIEEQLGQVRARTVTFEAAHATLEAQLDVTCDAATEYLDTQLAQIATLTPERRMAALECTLKHLVDARYHLVHTDNPEEFAEYDALCERLRDVRRLLA
jgi:CHAD domain-containing protein